MLPISLQLYRWAMTLAAPLSGPVLRYRANQGKEDSQRLRERFGYSTLDRPAGPLLWLHGASVGESLVLLDLVRRLHATTDWHFLMTSGTVTSARLLGRELPERALHQYLPLDRPVCGERFFNHWQPDAGVFVESELWPNLLIEAKRRHLPLALINARMNEGSLESWARRPESARYLLDIFRWIGAADDRTAKGLSALAGKDIHKIGNLKLQTQLDSPGLEETVHFKAMLGDRFVWLAASTHEGEDEALLGAHMAVMKTHPDALMILAPRHPERGESISKLMHQMDLSFARRSLGQEVDQTHSVWLADTLGEMSLWYSLAKSAFIGGSLIDGIGGHNPIEATRAGCPIVTGPHTASFDDVFSAYEAANGVIRASHADEIANAVMSESDTLTGALAALDTLSGKGMDITLTEIRKLMGVSG